MSEATAEQIAINKLIKPWEGYSAAAYWDNIGKCWTIGYGHTHNVEQHNVCTQAQADAFLLDDVAEAFGAVAHNVHVTLNENQFAALISFEFNTGAGAASGVWQNINDERFAAALDTLMQWDHDGAGNVIAGLVNRRSAERDVFLS